MPQRPARLLPGELDQRVQAALGCGLADARLRAELSQGEGRVPQAQVGDLAQRRAERAEVEALHRLQLRVRRFPGADEVRVVGVREAVRTRARGPDDRTLLQRQ